MKGRLAPALLALGLLAMLAGAGAWRWLHPPEPAVEFRPDISLAGLDGQPHALSEWDGKLVLLNFWATWCAPCLKEIPLLVETQKRLGPSGFQVVGIALDQVEPVAAFARRLNMNYPILVGEADVSRAMDALGDELGALPFSVLVGRDGRILARVSGDLSEAELARMLEGHL